ncbi:hypothetical protein [Halobacillus sp. HZG1]|uniref:hypothetical protein n=1 Tax=Halobacillus sp. HZG1 TaxID=3111769 RepID=UPI002DBB9209|nr:hypothetical protein [Halobacillus sp. HZG1]
MTILTPIQDGMKTSANVNGPAMSPLNIEPNNQIITTGKRNVQKTLRRSRKNILVSKFANFTTVFILFSPFLSIARTDHLEILDQT